MEFLRGDNDTFIIQGIDEFLVSSFQSLPMSEVFENEDAQGRLFPDPISDEDDPELVADWKAHVQPGLHDAFRQARDVVAADLRAARKTENGYEITIPRRHIEPWLHALNQYRLALAAAYELSDEQLSERWPVIITNSEGLIKFYIGFLAIIQEWLVSILEGEF